MPDDGSGPEDAPNVITMGKLYRQLDDLNVRTQKIYELQKHQVLQGYDRPLSITITAGAPPTYIDSNYKMPDGFNFDPPYMRADIFNEGPARPFFRTNDRNVVQTSSLPLNAMYVVDTGACWAEMHLGLYSLMLWIPGGAQNAFLTIYFKR